MQTPRVSCWLSYRNARERKVTCVSPDCSPVVIGRGEIKDRPGGPASGLEPGAVMAEALRRADAMPAGDY